VNLVKELWPLITPDIHSETPQTYRLTFVAMLPFDYIMNVIARCIYFLLYKKTPLFIEERSVYRGGRRRRRKANNDRLFLLTKEK